MKKFLLFILVICLCGCSSNSDLSNLDLKATVSDLDGAYTNMYELKDDELSLIYGLDVNKCEEYVIKASTLSNGDFYAIVKVNKENESEVLAQMKNLFATLEQQSNLYSPEAVQLIKNRLETSIGDYHIYLISKDNNALYELVKKHVN